MSNTEKKPDLDRIVFIGRTFDEYMSMFNLSEHQLIGRNILDCPSGACSFASVAARQGAHMTAADIAYDYQTEELEQKGWIDIDHAMSHVEMEKDNYVWNHFKSVDELRRARTQALSDFAIDIRQTPERYVRSELPMLQFDDNQFDLTVSAHFLFMYADRLDYDFHLRTIRELMRVTKQEIRIFPIVDLDSNRYEHMDRLLAVIQNVGWAAEEVNVPYEFQKGANSMLKINKTS